MSCKSWWWRGNDNFVGTPGRDWVFGGRGDNVVDALGGDDFIWTRRGDDTIDAGDGNDVVFAGRGDDEVNGGAGNDRIFAGRGDDDVDGGEGDDWIHAGRGDDNVTGGAGNDRIFAGRGDDTVDGGEGDDYVSAGRGDDVVTGGAGNDRVFGGRGDDDVDGGEGDDYVFGGRGDDVVTGGAGNDKVWAGHGDDEAVYSVSDNAGSRDYYNGGRGNDVLVLQMTHAEYASAAVQADLAAFDAYLADGLGSWYRKSFQFEAFDLKVKRFESYEVRFTDAAKKDPEVPPEAQDDVVLMAAPALTPILETESNDPAGVPLGTAAQVIDRADFLVAPSTDVGDDSLPRVSIEGTIEFSPDPASIPNPDDVDLYAITLEAGETMILDIDYGFEPSQGDHLVTRLYVLDEDGNELPRDSLPGPVDSGGGSQAFFDPYFEFTDGGTGGTYYVAVSSFGNAPGTPPGTFTGGAFVTGDYTLNLSIRNPAPDLGAFAIDPATLLANDSDANGDPLSIVSVGNSVNGEVSMSASGEILFKPASDAPGSFEYTVSDGKGGESTATVTVNGNPVQGTSAGESLDGTDQDDLFVGAGGGDTFNFAPASGNDTIADFTLGDDFLAPAPGTNVDLVEVDNGTRVDFDTGGSVLLVGVTGVTDATDLFS